MPNPPTARFISIVLCAILCSACLPSSGHPIAYRPPELFSTSEPVSNPPQATPIEHTQVPSEPTQVTPQQVVRGEIMFLAGTYVLPHEKRPTGDKWELVQREYIQFSQNFRTPPIIQLSMRNIELYTSRPGTFYRLSADNVTTSGFELAIYGAYATSFSNCTIDWLAVGNSR